MDTLIPYNWSNIRQTVNTPHHVTDNFEFTPTSEKTAYKDCESKATSHILFSDPQLALAFTGKIYALAGIAIARVGSALTDLPNFTDLATGSTWRGHDPDDGTIILEDAKDTLPGGPEMISTSWTARHYPFLDN